MLLQYVEHLSEEGAKTLLKKLIQQLDELDGDDFFGSEGWRHCFGLED